MSEPATKICPACGARSSSDHRFCPSCGDDITAVEVAEGDPYLGLIIADKYRLQNLIGEGAMGRVYKATQTTLGKPFAAKILAPHLTNDEASHARFANEAHNCASLNHPNCVSVVDYGRTRDGITYIVMEFIEGNTLEDIIVEQFPLSRERIVDLTLQILAALTEAHGLGILHRDLKPENILVQQLRTHGELAKVLDFGIAKLMDAEATGEPGLTNQGMVCGTPEYMSPEQARGHKLDARSDLYAVGVILYQMLVGRPPFESSSAVEILHKHLHEDPVPPNDIMGLEADAIDAVCMKAMSKEPDARFSSAVEFREALIGASNPAASQSLSCDNCKAPMRSDDRFCASCGAPAPSRPPAYAKGRKRHPTRRSGLSVIHPDGERTAEVVVRNFPLPLAGRADAFEHARKLLDTPSSRVRSVAYIGPHGVGKTRMGDEVAGLAETMGWRVFYVGADPSGARWPLWPIRCMVAQLLDLDPMGCTTQDLGRAANLSGVAFEELPGLAELFELAGPAHALEYQVRKRECYASAVVALTSGGRGQPIVLVFDDVDFFDTPSRDILRRLVKAKAEDPVAVVITSTDDDVDWLGDEPLVEQLEPLGAEEILDVARSVTRDVKPDSTLPQELAAAAPLTPSRLENQLRLLALGVDVPPGSSEGDLIRTRLENLDEAQRYALTAAAVLGERFPEVDLYELSKADEDSPDDATVEEALTRLHVSGLLIITGKGERAFPHRMLYDVVYSSASDEQRRHLHALAAETSRVAKASITARAIHLQRAGSPDAVQSLMAAAQSAERSFDDPSAAGYLHTALRVAATLPEGRERREIEAELALRATRVMRSARDADQAISMLRGQLENPPAEYEGPLLQALGVQLMRAKSLDEATTTLQRALGPAIATGDRAQMVQAYSDLGQLWGRRGDYDRAVKELREGLDMFTMGEGPRADVDLDLWRYLLRLAEALRAAGKTQDCRTWCEHALFQAERRGDRLGLLRCHAQMAWVLRDLRQLLLAEQHLARSLDEARYFGDRLTTAELLIERSRARAARGRIADARRCCEEALRLAQVIDWSHGVRHAERALSMLRRQPTGQTVRADQSGSYARPGK